MPSFNLTEVLISDVYVARWRYQLKVDRVKLLCEVHVSLNQRLKPRSFQFSKGICVGYQCSYVDFLLLQGRAIKNQLSRMAGTRKPL